MRSFVLIFLLFTAFSTYGQTPAAAESRILGHLATLEKARGGSTDDSGKVIERENEAITKEFLALAKLSSAMNYPFAKLAKKAVLVTSPDRKLRVFSWDDQTGGSARRYGVVFLFADAKGRLRSSIEEANEDDVCNGFYHQVIQNDGKAGRHYLLVSTAICGGGLASENLSAVRIDGTRISDLAVIKTASGLQTSVGFQYSPFSVKGHNERPMRLFNWNASTREFSFPVVIEDDDAPAGRVTDKSITYRFDGKYYIKLK